MAKSSTSFAPGQSGNPGGRPRVLAEVVEVARKHTSDAIETLVSIMRDEKKPAAARVAAANAVLDRGYGKPYQDMRHEVTPSDPWNEILDLVDGKSRDLPNSSTVTFDDRAAEDFINRGEGKVRCTYD